MSRRAVIAQIDDDGGPTMAESMRSTRGSPDESRSIWDEAYPRLERNNSSATLPQEEVPSVNVGGEPWGASEDETQPLDDADDQTQPRDVPRIDVPRVRMDSFESLDADDADIELLDEPPASSMIHAPAARANANPHASMIG